MYTQYFGLKEKPFAIAPDPRYLYMSELHREALAHLLYGISNDSCLILLTGDVGTGKTTVSRCLLEQLPEKANIAIILNPKLSILELFKTICEELGIPVSPNSSSVKTYIDSLNSYLLDTHAKGRSAALIIDEAQHLDIEILEQLRLLTNLETNTHKLLQIILLGHPELRQILSSPELSHIDQRITSRYHLRPLEADDVEKYILHRINIAGGPDTPLFSRKAIKHIIKISQGIPRTINVLCDRALLGAYTENKDHVDLQIMKKAAREVTAGKYQPFFTGKQFALALLIFISGVFWPTEIFFSKYEQTLPLLQQPVMQQTTKTSEQRTIVVNPEQRVILISPVHYDTNLTENAESAKQSALDKTSPDRENSSLKYSNNHQYSNGVKMDTE